MNLNNGRSLATTTTCLLIIVLLVAGCGLTAIQKTTISRFGDGAETLGGLTAEEFRTSRNDVIEMRTMMREAGDKNIKSPDGNLTVERTEIRVRAAKTLARYGKVLKALIGSDNKQEIQNATDGLLRSIDAVEGVSVSTQQSGAIAQAVATVGGLFIEHTRKKAVKEVVPAMHEPMLLTLGAMKASFQDYGESGQLRWSAAYAAALSDLGDLSTNVGGVTAEQQARADAFALKKKQRFETTSKKILESIESVRAAHTDLKNVLVSDEVSVEALQDFMAEIDQLVETYEILSEQ